MSLSSFDTDITANKIKQTYIRGFIDISGGDLNVQNGNINVFSGETMPVFRVVGDHFVVKDRTTSNYVDVSLDKLIQLNSITSNVDQDISSIKQRITAVSYLDGNTYLADGLNVSGGAVFTSGLNVSGGAAVFSNAVSFAARWPTWDGAVGDPSLNNQFVTKAYADVNGGTILLGAGRENTWYSNNFVHGNTVFPVVPPRFDGSMADIVGNSLVTKSYVDINGGAVLLGVSQTNIWNSKNGFYSDTCFNRYPVFTGVGDPSLNEQFVTKGYADVNGGTILLGAGRENTWYSNNFVYGNTVFPVVPPRFDGSMADFVGNSLVTKSYVDENGGTSLLGAENLFTQKNSFQVDVSMGQSLVVYGDISLNGSLRVGGSVATNATALNFDCGGPATNYTFSTKFDAGGV